MRRTKCFVTGGAGFIGSHLVERLCELNTEIIVYDNLARGKKINIEKLINTGKVRFIKGDLNNCESLNKAIEGCEVVIHLAAYTNTSKSSELKDADLNNGTIATWNLLDAMRKKKIDKIIFISSQLVYGNLKTEFLSEETGPLLPISLYGASKLACEGLVSAYSNLFGINAVICRFCNIIGGRMWRGIIYDFYRKLKDNLNELHILGDGKQTRNYLFIDECIDVLCLFFDIIMQSKDPKCEVYNIGNNDFLSATEIANIIINEMNITPYPKVCYDNKPEGWPGDLTKAKYNISKIKALGWQPKISIENAVKKTLQCLSQEIKT